MTTALARRRPLAALAHAEYLQFRRNKTLVYLGTVSPIAIPLVTYFVARRDSDSKAALAATTLELFAFGALLLVQYYSVLSMVTTRRGEGVLKRLRTGEASDWQIQTAPAVPGLLLTVVGAVVVSGVVYGLGAPAPANPVALVLAIAGGFVLFSLLALATSAVTKNAEAAQITSLPLLTLAVLGLGSIRTAMPDRLADVLAWTPFAAVSDLVSLGTSGKVATAGTSAPAHDFAGTFADFGRPVATLAVWTVLALVLVHKCFRWDDRG